jgi:hypothetical protein
MIRLGDGDEAHRLVQAACGILFARAEAQRGVLAVAVACAGDIPVAVDGEEIPILGFAMSSSWVPPSASASPRC